MEDVLGQGSLLDKHSRPQPANEIVFVDQPAFAFQQDEQRLKDLRRQRNRLPFMQQELLGRVCPESPELVHLSHSERDRNWE